MYGYIYMTTNNISGKKYIGRKTAESFDKNYYGSGIHLKRALKKYGRNNFSIEILCECDSYKELVEKETYYIKLNDAVNSDNFYNNSYGGYSEGFEKGENNIAKRPDMRKINSEKHKGKKMPDEFRKRQSEIHLGKPSGMSGKHHSKETIKVLSEISSNQVHTEERDKKVSSHHKGSKMMTNGQEQRWVYKDDIQKMLDNGWSFGSCKKRNRDYTGKNNPMFGKSASSNKKWINKYEDNKIVRMYIPKDELETYLSNGWKLGMK